ncbi:MAG: methyltransferase domain-containing protein [Candidatus Aenigmarchaeota archaeon]|nr:methyltransferase domain-containing protein [Candidatus Aenigmarchaeota archaeon]
MRLNRNFFQGKRTLNVGCGNDTFGTDFVDIYPSRKVIKCNVDEEKLPYKKETFDVVYSRCNFEHLRCPRHFLDESYRVLKRRGILIIITDNANYIGYIINRTHHGGYIGYGKEDVHYGLYTKEHLIAHLKSSGFKVLYAGYTNSDILCWRKNYIFHKRSLFGKVIETFGDILPSELTKRISCFRVAIVGLKI